MSNLFTIISFTFRNKFRSKSFIISTLILAVILSLGINLPYIISNFSGFLFGQDGGDETRIGILDNSPLNISEQLDEYFSKMKETGVAIVPLPDAGSLETNEQMAKDKIASGDIAAFLEIDAAGDGRSFPKFNLISEEKENFALQEDIRSALQTIKTNQAVQQLDISMEEWQSLNAPIEMDVVRISTEGAAGDSPDKTTEQQMIGYFVTYAFLVVLFMTVMMYGNLIASEITAEKSSRVMELLISSVKPLTQMFGKIIAMCMLGITQIAVFAAIVAINLSLPHNREAIGEFGIPLNSLDPWLAVYFIVFYLLGFFLFATIFAAIGSLVSRTEDLGQALTPVTFLMLGAFYIGIFGINAADSTFVTAMSFVPFFTPFVMMLRIGMAEPPIWQVALSIVELLLFTLLMGWLAAKIYRTGVLLYGKRPSFKELRRAMKAYKV